MTVLEEIYLEKAKKHLNCRITIYEELRVCSNPKEMLLVLCGG